MGSYYEAEEDKFFDAREEVSCVSDVGSDCSEDRSTSGHVLEGFGYEFWTKTMEDVNVRRDRLLRWMRFSLDRDPSELQELRDMCSDDVELRVDKIGEQGESVSGELGSRDQFLSSPSLFSCPLDATVGQLDAVENNPMCTIRNLDDGTEFLVDELGPDGMLRKLRVVGSNQKVTVEEFQESVGSSSLVQRFLQKKVKKSWIRKLGVVKRMVDRKGESKYKVGGRVGSILVHSYKKRLKELSSVYAGQDFSAHKGSILTMKFSPDGQYLASGGEDNVVRVWRVVEDGRPSTFDFLDSDPSCLYFSLDHLSKFAPLDMNNKKVENVENLSKSSKSTCVIFPPKIFRVLEKPLHEFHGHIGEVLALSWSKKGFLLSSSVDKTVRLWQIGQRQCLKVYCHNNYVTCVEFNPVDENYFISGSIDGKVRIWAVSRCQVIDWIDIREIVTAVCYSPNGKEGIVGTMDGNCYFYDIIVVFSRDGLLVYDLPQLTDGRWNILPGKKKFSGKRVTGFQFCPSDPSTVMVTSADSQVRILSGVNVISKFKGTKSSGSFVSASFTSDGKHVISACEDSNVYMWNYDSQDHNSCRPKHNASCESFLSHNASIAIPWCGMNSVPRTVSSPAFSGPDLSRSLLENKHLSDDLEHKMPVSSPDCFSLGRGFFLESLRGSPTWPEEKLPSTSPKETSHSFRKSEYKFLKTAYKNAMNSPNLWGLVIVTGGWDGRIRSYLNYGLPMLA